MKWKIKVLVELLLSVDRDSYVQALRIIFNKIDRSVRTNGCKVNPSVNFATLCCYCTR